MTNQTRISVFRSNDEFEQKAAEKIARLLGESIRERGKASIALSGGATPRGVYRRLGADPFKKRIEWKKVHIFFSDERAVPPKDPESNFGMAEIELLSRIEIPKRNVHRILGEINPSYAAKEYEKELKKALRGKGTRFDIVLLGLGEDGHTASLFPGTADVKAKGPLVAPVDLPSLKNKRITLTLRCINASRAIIFLVTGKKKAKMVQRLLSTEEPTADIPATLVRPKDGKLIWVLDEEAGASLVS